MLEKIQPALSAGRVQSVAVRLIVEREREIIRPAERVCFQDNRLFTIKNDKGEESVIKVEASKRFRKEEDAKNFLELCASNFEIDSVTVKPDKVPAAPFTTSTLQQEAYLETGFRWHRQWRLPKNCTKPERLPI